MLWLDKNEWYCLLLPFVLNLKIALFQRRYRCAAIIAKPRCWLKPRATKTFAHRITGEAGVGTRVEFLLTYKPFTVVVTLNGVECCSLSWLVSNILLSAGKFTLWNIKLIFCVSGNCSLGCGWAYASISVSERLEPAVAKRLFLMAMTKAHRRLMADIAALILFETVKVVLAVGAPVFCRTLAITCTGRDTRRLMKVASLRVWGAAVLTFRPSFINWSCLKAPKRRCFWLTSTFTHPYLRHQPSVLTPSFASIVIRSRSEVRFSTLANDILLRTMIWMWIV